MFKKSGVLFGLIFVLSACHNDGIPWINFNFASPKMGNTTFDKAAIFIDFSINDSDCVFSSQFDTGAFSFFHEDLILSFSQFNLATKNSLSEEGNYAVLSGSKIKQELTNVTYNFDNLDVKQEHIFLRPSKIKGISKKAFQSNRNTPMGTIGTQFCVNKVIIIDYPNERLARLDNIPSSYNIEKKIPFAINNQNWVLLPIKIEGSAYYVVFDTGSSIFPLLTTNRSFWEKYSTVNAKSDTLKVRSFDKIFETYEGNFSNTPVEGLSLKNEMIYLSNRPKEPSFVDGIEIIGVTGNKLFLDKVIAIDYINKEFNILKK